MNDFLTPIRRANRLKLNISTESIDFQEGNFGSQLEAILYDIEKWLRGVSAQNLDYLRTALDRTEFPKLLAECIEKRLGIKCKIKFNTFSIGSIMPMFLNEHHILLDKMWHGQIGRELPDQAKIIKAAKDKKGTVDLKNARVSGIFSEYQHDLFLDFVGHIYEFKSSIPEVVAIMLHEFGHAFTYYELADRLEQTNQVMVQLSEELRGKNNAEKKVYLFKELAGTFGIKSEEFDDMVNESNQTILGLKLFKKYVKLVKSQLPNAKYSDTSSEQVADNFATRFGYGRQLIEALDRLNVIFGSPEKNVDGNGALVFFELIMMHVVPFIFLLSNFLIGISFAGLFFPILYVFLLCNSGDSKEDMTYDVLKMRYKRIRQQYIEKIQKLNLDKEQLRAVINDVHFIDEIIDSTVIYKSLFNKLGNFLFSVNRDAKNDIEMQYLVEDLAHNNLFLSAAKLSVLS